MIDYRWVVRRVLFPGGQVDGECTDAGAARTWYFSCPIICHLFVLLYPTLLSHSTFSPFLFPGICTPQIKIKSPSLMLQLQRTPPRMPGSGPPGGRPFRGP